MNTASIIYMDLTEYGGEGIVELAPPSLRKQTITKNMLSRCAKATKVNGETYISEPDIGNSDIIKVLEYVRKSPFPQTVDGVLDFTDALDNVEYGNGARFWEDLIKKAMEVAKGMESPFVGSQGQETSTSE